MRIKLKANFVDMDFDTKDIKMVSIPSKYNDVDLALTKKDGSSMNIVIATLDFTGASNFEDATKLDDEIARRWNECENKL